jgi:acylphosphatase
VSSVASRLLVSGRVQGVGFRWFVVEAARRLNLAGWVRNRPDGTVEVCASGAEPAIRELESLVAQGPSGARVDAVKHGEPPREKLTMPFRAER